jgi:hypothetical protein
MAKKKQKAISESSVAQFKTLQKAIEFFGEGKAEQVRSAYAMHARTYPEISLNFCSFNEVGDLRCRLQIHRLHHTAIDRICNEYSEWKKAI